MPTDPSARPLNDLPARIGPYRIVRELGRGRLGPVVLARYRPSGDRVALRVIKPEWSCLPKYVSRITRSAFAAAQVEHPNLVRVLDLGESQGRAYFATEFVDGPSLADVIKTQGPLPAPRAVAHVLQAARGLRFAHGQGLVHGNIRSDCLFVDPTGLTRMADLGLSATPATVESDEARATRGPIAVGTEAQADADAAPIRDDVRGLGLTLTHLLTGKTEAHPTALLAAGLPMNLIELVRGLIEPKPGGNLAHLGQVVPALERFLNGRGTTTATAPGAEDGKVLAECVRSFRASPSARLRRQIILCAVVLCVVVVGLGLLARRPLFAASVLGLGLMTALADFVVDGITRRSALFGKVRGLIGESRGGDWLIGLGTAVVFAAALVALNLHGAWIAFGVLAVVMAAWLHIVVDGKVTIERRGAVEEAQALLKRLRLQGVSEESLRRFVRSTAGISVDGEAFFEALFGFDALMTVREPLERGLVEHLRRGSLPWREAVASWLDARQASRRRERDRVLLQTIEERGLVAEGVNLLTARRKARRISEALLTVAAEIRAASAAPATAEGTVRPNLSHALHHAAEAPEEALIEHDRGVEGRDYAWVIDLVAGPRTRFLLGSALLAGFLLWVHQNQVISETQIQDVASRALEAPDPLHALRTARIDVRLDGATRPLQVSFLPRSVANLFDGLHAGVAGLILVVSSLLTGSRVGLFALPGAVVALFGPSLGIVPTVAMTIGTGLAALGLFLGRTADD